MRDNKPRLSLPLNNYGSGYIFRRMGSKGEPVYMSCQAPEKGIINPEPRCELFIFDATNEFRIHATFSQVHASQWIAIVERLSAILDAWLVSN